MANTLLLIKYTNQCSSVYDVQSLLNQIQRGVDLTLRCEAFMEQDCSCFSYKCVLNKQFSVYFHNNLLCLWYYVCTYSRLVFPLITRVYNLLYLLFFLLLFVSLYNRNILMQRGSHGFTSETQISISHHFHWVPEQSSITQIPCKIQLQRKERQSVEFNYQIVP